MAQDNVEIVREGWRVWLRGDMDGLAAMWDPEIVWDTTHFHDWPESSYRGPDGVRQFLTEWLETWEDYEIEVDDVLSAPDGRVVSLIRQRGRGPGRAALEMSMVSAQTRHASAMASSFGSTTDENPARKRSRPRG